MQAKRGASCSESRPDGLTWLGRVGARRGELAVEIRRVHHRDRQAEQQLAELRAHALSFSLRLGAFSVCILSSVLRRINSALKRIIRTLTATGTRSKSARDCAASLLRDVRAQVWAGGQGTQKAGWGGAGRGRSGVEGRGGETWSKPRKKSHSPQ